MRTKEDADEFLELALQEWDETTKDYPFPAELSGQKTQLVMKMWRKQLVMLQNPDTGEKKFYKMHPAWKSHKTYENRPDYES